MTVTVNATATADAELGTLGTTVTNNNLTVAVGATALLACIGLSSGVTSVAVTWNSVAMTLVSSQIVGSNTIELWGMINPATGNRALVASWTGGSWAVLDAVSFAGTATDTIANAFTKAGNNSGTGTAVTQTATSAVGNINVCAEGCGGTPMTDLIATGSTLIRNDKINNSVVWSRATGAASLSWTSTISTSTNWVSCCIDVSVPAAASGPAPYQPWYQLAPILAQ